MEYEDKLSLRLYFMQAKNYNELIENINIINEKNIDQDLRKLKGINNKMLALLAKNDIISLDDFAGLSTFDLLDKDEGLFKSLELDKSSVDDMIMEARKKWFVEEEKQT